MGQQRQCDRCKAPMPDQSLMEMAQSIGNKKVELCRRCMLEFMDFMDKK